MQGACPPPPAGLLDNSIALKPGQCVVTFRGAFAYIAGDGTQDTQVDLWIDNIFLNSVGAYDESPGLLWYSPDTPDAHLWLTNVTISGGFPSDGFGSTGLYVSALSVVAFNETARVGAYIGGALACMFDCDCALVGA